MRIDLGSLGYPLIGHPLFFGGWGVKTIIISLLLVTDPGFYHEGYLATFQLNSHK